MPFDMERDAAGPITFLTPASAAWEAAWGVVARARINAGLADPVCAEDPDTGEVWQYMGTCQARFHEFRHRRHPVTGRRERIVVETPAVGR